MTGLEHPHRSASRDADGLAPAVVTPVMDACLAAAPSAGEPGAGARRAWLAGALRGVLRGVDGVVAVLALMMVLTPALGVTNELMLQDTLKSLVVSLCTLFAALLFFWQRRHHDTTLRWHAMLWLPLMLMLYALGSMAWSHTYLAGVEAIRWFLFTLLAWLGLNTLGRDRLPLLAWGIHTGAAIASLWAALQFWVDLPLFPQSAHPASTFVNRNFFAEFLVCTLPWSVWLLVRARQRTVVGLLAFSIGFNLVALLMTGTRSAQLALLALLVVLPFTVWRYRRHLAVVHWPAGTRMLAAVVMGGTVWGLSLIPTNDPYLRHEQATLGKGTTALERSVARAQSMTHATEYTVGSFSARQIMWTATGRLIAQHPVAGVGAGAWEVAIPLYQEDGTQLETDYYAHNEILQLLAEYGLVGWIFLLALVTYLLRAAWRTWTLRQHEVHDEAVLRATALAGMLALLIVSSAGFPWRLASTGALFALFMAILTASDARLVPRGGSAVARWAWKPAFSRIGVALTLVCLALAGYIGQQAAACERLIVRATRIALAISRSGDVHDPRWVAQKQEMLGMVGEGIAINPHYRKLTPLVADELAKWGDWANAVWIWESVLDSRPHVTAIMTNIARGYSQTGQPDKAMAMLERARQLQPRAPSVRSLEVILLQGKGDEARALALAREDIHAGAYDYDMVNTGYVLAMRAQDWDLAIRAIELRSQRWPATRADGEAKLGHAWFGKGEVERAMAHCRAALAATPAAQRQALRADIPPALWSRLQP
jgi:O-antigen ligase